MLTPERSAYIAAMEPLRFEALLGKSEQIAVVGSGSGETIPEEIMGLCPDFLLLDGVLSGLDSLSLLERLSETMPCPPRVLYLGREDKWLGLALQRGADAAAAWNTDDEIILRLTESTAQKPLPRLAEHWEADRMEIAEKYAVLLRIPEALKGKQYICRAVSALACAPQLGASFTGLLYPLVASSCLTSARAVEKAIRTAVESTWLRGDLNAIQTLFGYSVDAERGKPTNAEFLSMLAGYVRRDLARRMREKERNDSERMGKIS